MKKVDEGLSLESSASGRRRSTSSWCQWLDVASGCCSRIGGAEGGI